MLPLREVGGEMDVAQLPVTKTKVGLVLADVGQALFLSRLREFPQFEVGLLRAEFMLGNISIHPQLHIMLWVRAISVNRMIDRAVVK